MPFADAVRGLPGTGSWGRVRDWLGLGPGRLPPFGVLDVVTPGPIQPPTGNGLTHPRWGVPPSGINRRYRARRGPCRAGTRVTLVEEARYGQVTEHHRGDAATNAASP